MKLTAKVVTDHLPPFGLPRRRIVVTSEPDTELAERFARKRLRKHVDQRRRAALWWEVHGTPHKRQKAKPSR